MDHQVVYVVMVYAKNYTSIYGVFATAERAESEAQAMNMVAFDMELDQRYKVTPEIVRQ